MLHAQESTRKFTWKKNSKLHLHILQFVQFTNSLLAICWKISMLYTHAMAKKTISYNLYVILTNEMASLFLPVRKSTPHFERRRKKDNSSPTPFCNTYLLHFHANASNMASFHPKDILYKMMHNHVNIFKRTTRKKSIFVRKFEQSCW